MNNPNQQNPTTDQTQPGKSKTVPPSFDRQQPQDARETGPDTGKKPDAGKSSYLPNSGREDKPIQAARGDDDLMSKKPGKQG